MKRAVLLLTLTSVLVSLTPLAAQQRGGQPARPAVTAGTSPAEDRFKDSQGSVTIDGKEIRYTATAGTLALRTDQEKPKASMFFVAYTREGTTDLRTRPITFCYNGGPGSATVWLHMGSFGPRRVQMAADGFQPAPPFSLVNNENSLLDVTDLVFVDAVSTGWSRAAVGEDPKQFHGVRPDIQAFGEFINAYLSKFNRWSSPKFLFGESYGTMRSAGLAGELQERHGIELNGIILLSSVLDYMTKGYVPGNDIPYPTFLPTFTATAWYHKKLPADLQAMPIDQAVAQSRTFSWGEYIAALHKGNTLTDAERKAVAQKVARFSGLSAEFVERANLRVSDMRFREELLRDRRVSVGRLDGRFTGVDADAARETQEYDPANTALQGAYTALFSDYAKNTLKFTLDLPYFTSGAVQPWSYSDFQNRYLNLVDTLRSAMARNPTLKVLVANGYFDMATPFSGTEYTFTHMAFEPSISQRVQFTYYEAGHMVYVRPSMHKKLKADVSAFITGASHIQ